MPKKMIRCPKCGSSNVSNVSIIIPPLRGKRQIKGKQWPEPYNDEPPDKVIRPKIDFNHQYYCNSCKHYFGGCWGGA